MPKHRGRQSWTNCFSLGGQVGTLSAQIEEVTLELRWGALGPSPSARRDTEVLCQRGLSLPAPVQLSPGGARRVPRLEAERGLGLNGLGGVGRGREAEQGPHRPRRLARAPKVPAAAGGGSQAVEEKGRWRRPRWSATRRKLSSPAQQGKVQHAPAPRSTRPPAAEAFRRRLGLRRPREGEGTQQPRGLGRSGAPAAEGGGRAGGRGCPVFPEAGGGGGCRAPLLVLRGGGGPTRWRWFPGQGLRWGGGRKGPWGCVRQESTPCARRASSVGAGTEAGR